MVVFYQAHSRESVSGSSINSINNFSSLSFVGHVQFLSKPSRRLTFKGQKHAAISIFHEKTAKVCMKAFYREDVHPTGYGTFSKHWWKDDEKLLFIQVPLAPSNLNNWS